MTKMKLAFNFLKYSAIILSGFVFFLIAGLLVYYHLQYEPPPALPEKPDIEFGTTSAAENKNNPFAFIPVPKQMEFTSGAYSLPEAIHFNSPEEKRELTNGTIERQLGLTATQNGPVSIRFTPDLDLPEQGYSLTVSSSGLDIKYADDAGLFYSIITLAQIAEQTEGELPGLIINDWPDLPVRGAMLDISRDKIPTMDTLYDIIDFLANLKYNHLQLYVEGFSFDYPSFNHLWDESETPITGEEIQQLDQYAAERFIDLVPNQNSLGHMNAWLETDEFADLAECPDGYKLLGLLDFKSTLDVSDPRSMELVQQMADDMLPNFSSEYFNANLDEPFELGQCKNRELAEEVGVGRLYLDFVKELNNYVTEHHGRQMMMWGDIVAKHPEIIPQIPDDIILLEWGYEDIHPFMERSRKYREAGLEYMVCPGTSSWTTLAGRTENMKANISNAVESAIKYNAKGMLLTDWGDFGHWQYWPVSYAPFVYGSALSWNGESKEQLPLTNYLNRMVYRDRSEIMGDLVLDLGRYNRFEEYRMLNMTTTMQVFLFGILDKVMMESILDKMKTGLFDLIHYEDDLIEEVKQRFEDPEPYDYQSIIAYTGLLKEMLIDSDMDRSDANLIIDEFANAVRMIHLGAMTKQYILNKREYSTQQNIELLQKMAGVNNTVISEHERLWLARNRSGGLDRSLQALHDLNDQIERELVIMNRNAFSRFLTLQGEKLIAAAASIYIKMQ